MPDPNQTTDPLWIVAELDGFMQDDEGRCRSCNAKRFTLATYVPHEAYCRFPALTQAIRTLMEQLDEAKARLNRLLAATPEVHAMSMQITELEFEVTTLREALASVRALVMEFQLQDEHICPELLLDILDNRT